jgi:hypothetical protein
LRIVNVSDPANPTEVGAYNTPGVARGVVVIDTLAYVADGSAGGMRVVNVANPSIPHEIGFYDSPGDPWNLAIADTLAYLADGTGGGLRILNVVDPTSPQEIGSYDTQGLAKDIAVSGAYAFLADGGDGLIVFDVSTPSSPQPVGLDPGWVWGIKLQGSTAYLAGSSTGMRILDISNPLAPTVTGFYTGIDYSRDVALDGPHVYVANGYAGMQAYEYLLYGIDEFEQQTVRQHTINVLRNPVANREIALSVQLQEDATLNLSIYDAAGKRVHQPYHFHLDAGTHTITLPIQELPQGVYFLATDALGIFNGEKIIILE